MTSDYVLAEHWIGPLTCGGCAGLTDAEINQLEEFIEDLPSGGHWHFEDERFFARDEITDTPATCVEATYILI